MEKMKVNGWLREMTFSKFFITMLIFGVVFWKSTTDHIDDNAVHLDSTVEQATMQYVIENDMAHGAEISFIQLRNDIDAIKLLLVIFYARTIPLIVAFFKTLLVSCLIALLESIC